MVPKPSPEHGHHGVPVVEGRVYTLGANGRGNFGERFVWDCEGEHADLTEIGDSFVELHVISAVPRLPAGNPSQRKSGRCPRNLDFSQGDAQACPGRELLSGDSALYSGGEQATASE